MKKLNIFKQKNPKIKSLKGCVFLQKFKHIKIHTGMKEVEETEII